MLKYNTNADTKVTNILIENMHSILLMPSNIAPETRAILANIHIDGFGLA